MVPLSRTNITIVLVTICLITIFPTNASPTIIDGKYSLDNFMNPIQDKEQCNNYYTNNQHFCDPNNYITYPDKKKLGDIMHKSETNPIIACPFGNDGIQFGILIISSFNDYHSTKINKGFSISETSKFYAKLYHEKWEIGNDQCNNGILIFLNVADKYLHISTSTFLRTNYISDDFINNNIMPQIRPYLKSNQYTDGIIKIIELITDKCQIQLIDKMTEREKHTFDNKNSTQHTITHNYEFWIFMTIVIGILFLMWLIWYTKCCCCGECDENNNNNYRRHNSNNNRYQDEGVPFNQPGMAQRQPQNNNVHRMSSNLRSRNVYGNNNERLRKEREEKLRWEKIERERKEREERLKLEQQRKNNESIVDNGKRINNGGGVGMSWNNNGGNPNAPIETNDGSDYNEKLKNEKIVKEGKRIKNGGGGGMSWNDKNNNAPNEEPVIYKRTKDGGGGGGSW